LNSTCDTRESPTLFFPSNNFSVFLVLQNYIFAKNILSRPVVYKIRRDVSYPFEIVKKLIRMFDLNTMQ